MSSKCYILDPVWLVATPDPLASIHTAGFMRDLLFLLSLSCRVDLYVHRMTPCSTWDQAQYGRDAVSLYIDRTAWVSGVLWNFYYEKLLLPTWKNAMGKKSDLKNGPVFNCPVKRDSSIVVKCLWFFPLPQQSYLCRSESFQWDILSQY